MRVLDLVRAAAEPGSSSNSPISYRGWEDLVNSLLRRHNCEYKIKVQGQDVSVQLLHQFTSMLGASGYAVRVRTQVQPTRSYSYDGAGARVKHQQLVHEPRETHAYVGTGHEGTAQTLLQALIADALTRTKQKDAEANASAEPPTQSDFGNGFFSLVREGWARRIQARIRTPSGAVWQVVFRTPFAISVIEQGTDSVWHWSVVNGTRPGSLDLEPMLKLDQNPKLFRVYATEAQDRKQLILLVVRRTVEAAKHLQQRVR